jgi:hypothetical protein
MGILCDPQSRHLFLTQLYTFSLVMEMQRVHKRKWHRTAKFLAWFEFQRVIGHCDWSFRDLSRKIFLCPLKTLSSLISQPQFVWNQIISLSTSPWSKVYLQQLILASLHKQFCIVYTHQKLIAFFTPGNYWSMLWVGPQSCCRQYKIS